MSRLVINGTKRLKGSARVQGSKNSALPILAAAILCRGESVIHNCPELSDVRGTINILRYLGCDVSFSGGTLVCDSSGLTKNHIPNSLMREMRSSIIFLGALLARTGSASMCFPGGCEIGPRPIDLHLKALEALGAEICDLADFLNGCGADISGAGDSTIVIEGKSSLRGCCHTIIPDRIAAATLLSCCAATGGRVTLTSAIPSHLGAVLSILEECGCDVDIMGGCVTLDAPNRLCAPKVVRTMPYPGFPTDAQAPVMAMAAKSRGTTLFIENIFENRYLHVSGLLRMGANIKVEGRVAVLQGARCLHGADVAAMDLRGAAALITAALGAQGRTTLEGLRYLDRGYECLEATLSELGADVKRI